MGSGAVKDAIEAIAGTRALLHWVRGFAIFTSANYQYQYSGTGCFLRILYFSINSNSTRSAV